MAANAASTPPVFSQWSPLHTEGCFLQTPEPLCLSGFLFVCFVSGCGRAFYNHLGQARSTREGEFLEAKFNHQWPCVCREVLQLSLPLCGDSHGPRCFSEFPHGYKLHLPTVEPYLILHMFWLPPLPYYHILTYLLVFPGIISQINHLYLTLSGLMLWGGHRMATVSLWERPTSNLSWFG